MTFSLFSVLPIPLSSSLKIHIIVDIVDITLEPSYHHQWALSPV